MDASEYQKLAARTGALASDISETKGVQLALFGLTTETAEVVQLWYKHIRDNRYLDRAAIVDEVGDVLWNIAELCTLCDISLSFVMERNIAKLQKRHPNGFNHEASINRKDG